MTITMPDGRLVRLVPQDGPPTEPGLYLAEYTPLHGMRHTVARDVFRHCAGSMILGPDETRLEWWARVETIASGGGLIRGATVDGDAIGQRGEGAGVAELSTPGREVVPDWWTAAERRRLIAALDDAQQERLEAESVVCTLRARLAELEAAARWVPVGERLPAAGSVVDVAHSPAVDGHWERATAEWDGKRWILAAARHWLLNDVTHWRPLPAGPEVQP